MTARVWEFNKQETRQLSKHLSVEQIEALQEFRKNSHKGPSEPYLWSLWVQFREKGRLTAPQAAALRNLRGFSKTYQDQCPFCLEDMSAAPWFRPVEQIVKELTGHEAEVDSSTGDGVIVVSSETFNQTMDQLRDKSQSKFNIRMWPRMLVGALLMGPPVLLWLLTWGLGSRVVHLLFTPNSPKTPLHLDYLKEEVFENDINLMNSQSIASKVMWAWAAIGSAGLLFGPAIKAVGLSLLMLLL